MSGDLIKRANEVLKWSCEITGNTKEIKIRANADRCTVGQSRTKAKSDRRCGAARREHAGLITSS